MNNTNEQVTTTEFEENGRKFKNITYHHVVIDKETDFAKVLEDGLAWIKEIEIEDAKYPMPKKWEAHPIARFVLMKLGIKRNWWEYDKPKTLEQWINEPR